MGKYDFATLGKNPINLMLSEFMEVLTESTSFGLIFFKEDRTILTANKKAINIEELNIGADKIFLNSQKQFDFFDVKENVPEPGTCPVDKVIKGNTFFNNRMIINNKVSGLQFYGNFTGKPVFTAEGEFLAGLLIIEDLGGAQKLQSEKENSNLYFNKQQVNTMDMIHELRTPLNSIYGFSELLKKTVTDIQKTDYLNAINFNAKKMLNAINNVLDKNKTGNIKKINTKQFLAIEDMQTQIQLQFMALIDKYKNKHVELVITLNTQDKHLSLQTNIGLFQSILNNLLSNAIKYTNKGYIEFGYSAKNDDGKYVFYIKDTGVGIKQSDFNSLYSPFERIKNFMTLKNEGAGLGLSITKKNVESLGGTIWCESEPGKGSTFYFTHPYTANVKESVAKEEAVALARHENKKLLIVEDDSFSLMLLEEMLKKSGIEIKTAVTGKKALDVFKRETFDLVFLDIHLPDMNGNQILVQMKKINQSIPVIALTADIFNISNEKSNTVDFDYFATKPITSVELNKLLNKFLIKRNKSNSPKMKMHLA